MPRTQVSSLTTCFRAAPNTLALISEQPLNRTCDATTATSSSDVSLRVANDIASRERAYGLAYEIYRQKGYIGPQGKSWLVAPYDLRPETLTLLAEDREKNTIATVSLVFDGPLGLPCDEVFGENLASLRHGMRRVVEVTRLAIKEAHLFSKLLLVRLFNWIYIYAHLMHRYDDFLIEVNPRHVNYYRRFLGFEALGEARPCPRVNGAPAVLLYLDLAQGEREILRVGGMGEAAGERTLYPYFLTGADESTVLRILQQQHRPMRVAEAQHFGLGFALSK